MLELLLPPFDVRARDSLHPLTGTLVRLLVERPPRSRAAGAARTGAAEEEAGEAAHAYLEAGEEQGLIEGEERRLLQSIVDFGDTLVREVMTPRPDIVAIQADATLDELRALFREQEYSRVPGLQGEPRQHPRASSSSRTWSQLDGAAGDDAADRRR